MTDHIQQCQTLWVCSFLPGSCMSLQIYGWWQAKRSHGSSSRKNYISQCRSPRAASQELSTSQNYSRPNWHSNQWKSHSRMFHDHKMVKTARKWMLLKWEERTPTASVQQTISLLRKVPTEIIAWMIMFLFLKNTARVTRLGFSKQRKPHQSNCKDLSVWVCNVSVSRVSTESSRLCWLSSPPGLSQRS